MRPSTRLASNDRFVRPKRPFLAAVAAFRSCPIRVIRDRLVERGRWRTDTRNPTLDKLELPQRGARRARLIWRRGQRNVVNPMSQACDMKMVASAASSSSYMFDLLEKKYGWGGRIRTSVCRNQNPVTLSAENRQRPPLLLKSAEFLDFMIAICDIRRHNYDLG